MAGYTTKALWTEILFYPATYNGTKLKIYDLFISIFWVGWLRQGFTIALESLLEQAFVD